VTALRRHKRLIGFLVGVALVYGVLALLQLGIDHARAGLLTPGDMTARDRLIELGSTVVLGSFRPVAVCYLWYQATQLKERRELVELDGVIKMIARVQPTDIDAYNFQVWNMAYNVQYDAPNIAEGWKWVREAVEFGEKGARRNRNHPKVWRLYFQIAWVFSHRCADVGDKRTKYFEKRVKEWKNNKHPYEVAIEWYERAYEAAIRPGAKRPNPVQLASWAHAYAGLARNAEVAGDFDTMWANRQKAIEVHRLLMDRFPGYAKGGTKAVTDLQALMALHRDRRDADAYRDRGELKPEIDLRVKIAQRWRKLLEGNPGFQEAQRNLDRSAENLDALARRLRDPRARSALGDWYGELKKNVDNALLGARYSAAHHQRGSPEAARKLIAAVASRDQELDRMPLRRQKTKENRELIRTAAGIWVRIILNPLSKEERKDETGAKTLRKERAQKALTAISRYDQLARAKSVKTDEEEFRRWQQTARLGLDEYWRTLIAVTDVDSQTARDRVRDAALRHQKVLLSYCDALLVALRDFKRLASQEGSGVLRLRTAARIRALTARQSKVLGATLEYWSALLRRDEAYAVSAEQAEKELLAVAQKFDELAEARVLAAGEKENDFARRARTVWRTLYQFDPRNPVYAQNARRGTRRKQRQY